MEKVCILDCGGQYTKVIDRKVRELGVYTDIFPMGINADKISAYGGIILSGGPSSVWSSAAPEYDRRIFTLGIPVLGICYGMQLISDCFGGEVKPEVKTEYGQTLIDIDNNCPLFTGLDSKEQVLMSHGDAVVKLANGFTVTAKTGEVVAGIWNPELRIAGVQFHPEVDLTVNGLRILDNFLRSVCGFTGHYEPGDRIADSVEMIRKKVGDGNVIVLVSGGVDSAVTAALLARALPPEHIFAIHIDHGMMRKNESDLICENLKKQGLKNLKRVNAADEFFNGRVELDGKLSPPLNEITDPELKRAVIGSMFIKVTREAAESFGLDFDHTFLAQGTLRPDLIESGNPLVSGYAHKIKTHHNDVDIVRRAREKGLVIETNWDWHKDEVRKIARILGLDEEIASRQPFPGPGLAVRLIASDGGVMVEPEKQEQTVKLGAELGFKAAVAPVRSVGVQGDNRSYRNLALMSGKGIKSDWNKVFEAAKTIPNKLDYINRVAYRIDGDDISGNIFNYGMHVCPESAELLRNIDDIVTHTIMNPGISQCFAVLFPASGDPKKKYSAAIRAVVTGDFMTARPAIPGKDFPLEAMSEAVELIKAGYGDKIDMVLYDVTGKPPATVEWE